MHRLDRSDTLVESGRAFRPGDPVLVRVVHREHRILISDDGSAIQRAGHPRGWKEVARRIGDELDVNISRHGVVSLPVVLAGPSESEVVRRIGEAADRFYQELLELGD